MAERQGEEAESPDCCPSSARTRGERSDCRMVTELMRQQEKSWQGHNVEEIRRAGVAD